MGIGSLIYRRNIVKRYDDDHIIHYLSEKDFPGLQARPIGFRSAQGIDIKGYIYSYEKHDKADLVVFCHGLGGGHRSYMHEIQTICSEGYEVLSYDYVGCFESGGKDIRGLGEALSNLVSCLDWIALNEELKGRGLHLVGHSWGGYAVSNILSYRSDNIKSITAISAFAGIRVLAQKGFGGKMKPILRGIMKYEAKTNPDYAQSCSVDALKDARIPVLLIHSKDDGMVDIGAGLDYVKANVDNPNVRYITVEGKYHNPNYSKDAVEYMRQCFGEYERRLKDRSLKTLEQRKAYMDGFDFMRMTAQDAELWAQIFAFIGSAA